MDCWKTGHLRVPELNNHKDSKLFLNLLYTTSRLKNWTEILKKPFQVDGIQLVFFRINSRYHSSFGETFGTHDLSTWVLVCIHIHMKGKPGTKEEKTRNKDDQKNQ
uniref:Uncharacterized protein n=1 Tax=Megaselia scalaris TaxID=36166 RepID=T1GRV8_MEGSC